AFGVVFELPVFTFFLARAGIVNHKMMIGAWRYSVVGIFIVAAVLTPGPDVASQMLMATPLLVLYAASIGVAYAFGQPARGAPRPAGGERRADRDCPCGDRRISRAGDQAVPKPLDRQGDTPGSRRSGLGRPRCPGSTTCPR